MESAYMFLTVKMLPSWPLTRLWKSFPPKLSFPFADFRKTFTTV